MLDLIPTLLAQTTKQAIQNPTPSIEPASLTQQKTSLSLTSVSAIAVPEPTPIAAPNRLTPDSNSTATQIPVPPPETATTPMNADGNTAIAPPPVAPASTSSPASSQVVLPPQKAQITPIVPLESSSSKPSTPLESSNLKLTKPVQTNLTQPAKPIAVPQPSTAVSTSPDPQKSNAQTVIPSVKPSVSPGTALQQQQLLLEQRLSEIVANDRAVKQAAQRDTLVNRAYRLATARRFDQARKLLQDPTLPIDLRNQILTNINALETASRSLGVTKVVEPIARSKPAQTPKQVAVRIAQPKSVARITNGTNSIAIQVPRAIQSLPAPQLKARQAFNEPSAPQSDPSIDHLTDRTTNPGTLVTPDIKTLQAYNRNLSPLRGDKILYPLPDPVPVTSKFGWRVHPITQARRFHAGVDLGAAQGTPVLASKAGRVTVADRMGGYGLAIVMQNNDGTQDTLYAHLSQILVRPGARIQPGTVIGRVGSTGLSTGPHLHYEARRLANGNWTAVDPGLQLEAAKVRLIQARQATPQASIVNEQG